VEEEDLYTFNADRQIWFSKSFGGQTWRSNLQLEMERNAMSIRRE